MSEAEYFSHFISNGNGKLLEIPQRRGRQDGVFIDWLSFTLHEDSLLKVSGCPLVSDAEYMFVLSKKIGGNIRVWHHEQMQIEGQ